MVIAPTPGFATLNKKLNFVISKVKGLKAARGVVAFQAISGIIKAVGGIYGTAIFMAFIMEEAQQASSMGVWVLINNKLWDEAQRANDKYKEMIQMASTVNSAARQAIEIFSLSLAPVNIPGIPTEIITDFTKDLNLGFLITPFEQYNESATNQWLAFERTIAENNATGRPELFAKLQEEKEKYKVDKREFGFLQDEKLDKMRLDKDIEKDTLRHVKSEEIEDINQKAKKEKWKREKLFDEKIKLKIRFDAEERKVVDKYNEIDRGIKRTFQEGKELAKTTHENRLKLLKEQFIPSSEAELPISGEPLPAPPPEPLPTPPPAPPPAPPPPPPPPPLEEATLKIDSNPQGAEVLENGAVIGATPLEIKHADGTFNFTIRKEGFQEQSNTLEILAPGTQAWVTTLEPLPPFEKEIEITGLELGLSADALHAPPLDAIYSKEFWIRAKLEEKANKTHNVKVEYFQSFPHVGNINKIGERDKEIGPLASPGLAIAVPPSFSQFLDSSHIEIVVTENGTEINRRKFENVLNVSLAQ